MTSCLAELYVLVKIKVRGHLVMSIIQFMNLISVHFWTYLRLMTHMHVQCSLSQSKTCIAFIFSSRIILALTG